MWQSSNLYHIHNYFLLFSFFPRISLSPLCSIQSNCLKDSNQKSLTIISNKLLMDQFRPWRNYVLSRRLVTTTLAPWKPRILEWACARNRAASGFNLLSPSDSRNGTPPRLAASRTFTNSSASAIFREISLNLVNTRFSLEFFFLEEL